MGVYKVYIRCICEYMAVYRVYIGVYKVYIRCTWVHIRCI